MNDHSPGKKPRLTIAYSIVGQVAIFFVSAALTFLVMWLTVALSQRDKWSSNQLLYFPFVVAIAGWVLAAVTRSWRSGLTVTAAVVATYVWVLQGLFPGYFF